jgi:hypothetical protein
MLIRFPIRLQPADEAQFSHDASTPRLVAGVVSETALYASLLMLGRDYADICHEDFFLGWQASFRLTLWSLWMLTLDS